MHTKCAATSIKNKQTKKPSQALTFYLQSDCIVLSRSVLGFITLWEIGVFLEEMEFPPKDSELLNWSIPDYCFHFTCARWFRGTGKIQVEERGWREQQMQGAQWRRTWRSQRPAAVKLCCVWWSHRGCRDQIYRIRWLCVDCLGLRLLVDGADLGQWPRTRVENQCCAACPVYGDIMISWPHDETWFPGSHIVYTRQK